MINVQLPIDLYLVRHGESEGNVAAGRSKAGDDSHFTPAYRETHSSRWRITPRGIEQATLTGQWLRQHAPAFAAGVTSPYVRCRETAGHLGLPTNWHMDVNVRERWWGAFDVMPVSERNAKYAAEFRHKRSDALYWTPLNGESIADVYIRAERALARTARLADGGSAIIVTHGDTMAAYRYLIEQMSVEEWTTWRTGKTSDGKLQNCHVLHYTRRHPENSVVTDDYSHMRIFCPSSGDASPEYRPIRVETFSNADLLDGVERYPHLLTS